MNAHQMAVGSEVHIVARTNPSGSGGGGGGSQGREENSPKAKAGMSVFASLHRKLIVQQVSKKSDVGMNSKKRAKWGCYAVCSQPFSLLCTSHETSHEASFGMP